MSTTRVLIFFCATFCLPTTTHITWAVEQPNVLFIAIDDLNDYISPLDHHPGVKSPNLDRLAKRSVTFANAHCAAPACHPSRVAVMTGVHPTVSGIYRNAFRAHGPRWRHESKVLEKAVVLSQHFRDHGYRAVGGGKIFHTLQWTPGDSQNDPDAWDAYRGDPLDPISADWPRPKLVPDSEAGIGPGRPLGDKQYFGAKPITEQDEETYGDQLVVDWAIEQLNAKQEQPLFLAVGLFRPHIPFEVPQKYFDRHPLKEIQLPEYQEDDLKDAHPHERVDWQKWVVDNKQWPVLMQGYLASISYVDHQLGRLLDGLDASPLKENTIVILWTDHGFHIGEKDNWEKFALWDQTTHVPLFIHAPGVSKDGSKSQQPVTLTDLYPTLCDLAGLPVPEQCTGESLLPQLKNPEQPRERPAITSYRFAKEKVASHAVADERYRLIHYGNGFEELYDLETDPNEFTNRIDDPKLADIKKRLTGFLPVDAAPQASVPADSPYNLGRGGAAAVKIANRPLTIRLTATPKLGDKPDETDGVLAAHGGEVQGYSIFVQAGKLHFAIRSGGKLAEIVSSEPAPQQAFQVTAKLDSSGQMSLLIDDKTVATGEGALIAGQPQEGADVGRDEASTVGIYESPFSYRGKVTGVEIKTGKVVE